VAFAVATLVVALLFAIILLFPTYLVRHDAGSGGMRGLAQADVLKAKNDVRTTLLQGLGGAFFLATAFFTWRQIRISQRQLRVAEDEQIAGRFTHGIEQLGNVNARIRIGGIYALERIAWDSARDHGPTIEVLTAFVREAAPWPPVAAHEAAADLAAAMPSTSFDVQAALTVIGRRNLVHERTLRQRPINLSVCDLRGSDLRGAYLQGAHLNNAHLDEADLREAHLEDARLIDSHLQHARLRYAHLERARLIRAHLEKARLVKAHLEGAQLMDARLEGAGLAEAHLEGADLSRAHLEGAYLRTAHLAGAVLTGVHYDAETSWPEDFAPSGAMGG
jgi:hypothetical protein